jgi:hypothetical protein
MLYFPGSTSTKKEFDMLRKHSWILVICLAVLPILTACQPAQQVSASLTEDYPAGVATAWFTLQLQLIKETPGFTPPVASRALGYSGVAPRTFSSFYAAAAEAAISRLYGGIHYRAAIELGVAQGKCIGAQILALQFKK